MRDIPSVTHAPAPSGELVGPINRYLRIRRRVALVAAGILASLAIQSFGMSPPEASAVDVCTKYASTTGSNTASGTKVAPFRTAEKLANSLSAGQIGCLRSGTYTEVDTELKITKPGITLQSAPAERAKISARVVVAKGADNVTVRDLNLDGSPNSSPSPTVNANHTKWLRNDVTNLHKSESCFMVGDITYGIATGTLIQGNRVHDCGRLPRTNLDHGIYLKVARDTKILDNKIYKNSDRGIQLRTDAQRTLIKHNVIDGNGEGIIFSGADGTASNDTTVENNVISFSAIRFNAESFYPSGNPVGQRNVVRQNCVFGGARDTGNGGIQAPQVGFSVSNNTARDPLFVDRAAGDYRLRADSPCRTILTS